MVSLGFSPEWFFQYGIALELIFAIITLFVSIYAFKIYNVSKERTIKLFGIAFLLFSISYLVQSALNIGILFKLSQNIPTLIKVSETLNLGIIALFAHMMLITSGLVILSTLCFRTKNPKMLLLLLAVSLIPIFLSRDPLHTFFILSTIFLIFISYNYMIKCTKTRKTTLVFVSFLLLLLSNIQFIFAPYYKIFYVIAHILILIAYILILINLILVSNK